MILILDHAARSRFNTLPSRPTRDRALEQAYLQYKSSGTRDAVVNKRFPRLPGYQQYSILEITKFVLSHRLQLDNSSLVPVPASVPASGKRQVYVFPLLVLLLLLLLFLSTKSKN
jgi:hypothetical protein